MLSPLPLLPSFHPTFSKLLPLHQNSIANSTFTLLIQWSILSSHPSWYITINTVDHALLLETFSSLDFSNPNSPTFPSTSPLFLLSLLCWGSSSSPWLKLQYCWKQLNWVRVSYSLTYCWFRFSRDADSGLRGPCPVAAANKFTRTAEVLWRKGTAWPLSKWERGPQTQPGQAFIAFLGTLHWGWSSFTMHRFTVGDYLLQITKERMLLITSKRRMLQIKGKGGWTGYTPYLGGLAHILGSYFKDVQ